MLERFVPMVVAQNALVVGGDIVGILMHDCGLPPETFILSVVYPYVECSGMEG